MYSIFSEEEENNSNTFYKLKINYKSKLPFSFWVGWTLNEIYLSDYGIAYTTSSKKWKLTFFFNKNLEKNNILTEANSYLFSKNLGWIIRFRNKNNFFIKYTNCFDNNNPNELNLVEENDFMSFGNLFEIKNLIIGYEFIFNARDLLTLNYKDGIANISVGYKLK